MCQDDWHLWEATEFLQLQQYADQGMFGDPVPFPHNAPVFRWVWVYVLKHNPTKTRRKARAVCDGSPRAGKAVITGHTFSATPDITDFRLFLALSALEGKFVYGSDVSNAFAEAACGPQCYYMYVDAQFAAWWIHCGHPPIPKGHVIPVLNNLQGHPEAPRQWALHIDHILRAMGFTPTTHATCLYRGTFLGIDVLFLRQVDDFTIATSNLATFNHVCDLIDAQLHQPMKRFGILKHYNGVDIQQTRHFIHITAATYLTKVFERHGWTKLNSVILPMPADNSHVRALDSAVPLTDHDCLQLETDGPSFRMMMGELIWPMITCRPDIAFLVIKLSQFSNAPAALHFTAAKCIFRYLSGSLQQVITYWRQAPCSALPNVDPLHVSLLTLLLLPLAPPASSVLLIVTGPWIRAIAALSLVSSLCLLVVLWPGNAVYNLPSLCQRLRLNYSVLPMLVACPFACAPFSLISGLPNSMLL